jgi:carboxysome shell carbonic anhydrase
MNTRNAYRRKNANDVSRYKQAPVGMAQPQTIAPAVNGSVVKSTQVADVSAVASTTTTDEISSEASSVEAIACSTLPVRSCRHPLTDLRANAQLARCEEAIKGRFETIVPALKKLANLQHEKEFVTQAQALAKNELGYELPKSLLEDAWLNGLDMQAMYAHCIFGALQNSVAQFAENLRTQAEDTVDAQSFFLDCGFHCVDITPCSDGRLKGLSKYILRLPLSALTVRNAYAGALFNVEANIRHWESVELARFRTGMPVTADAGTHYLKVVVYHRSSSDPSHQGCAAHGSNDRVSAEAGLARLHEFREAIENSFCCGASVDILLIGVDTDTDAIRVHIPDSKGELNVFRYVDNAQIYADTLNFSADNARIAVYNAVNKSSEAEGWGAGEGQPQEGLQRLIVNLLINNLSQIEYVSDLYEGRYPDIGHAERYISVGDGFQEVQLRNLAYYAHLHTVEEGAADLDIGIKIFTGLNLNNGLPVPVAIHYRYDSKVPGSRQRMIDKCQRIKAAIENRYPELAAQKKIICQMSLQDKPLGSVLEIIDEDSA